MFHFYCLNGGICSLLNGLRVCQCPIGYKGDTCEIAPTTQAPSTLDGSTMATENITQMTNATSSSQIPGLSDAEIIGIVFGVLGVIVIIFIFIVCFCALVIRYRQRNMMLYSKPMPYDIADDDGLGVLYNISYAQRAGRSNLRRDDDSDQFRLPSYLFDTETNFSERTSDLFRSTDGYTDESYSVTNPSFNVEEDRRMQQLAEVITQSPYLNERMRSQITDVTSPSRLRAAPRSEFVRPYLATGQEEEFISLSNQSEDAIGPARIFQIPRAHVPWGLQESHM
nr:uncharacterized protein LOC129277506 [Lytechinus pictus]